MQVVDAGGGAGPALAVATVSRRRPVCADVRRHRHRHQSGTPAGPQLDTWLNPTLPSTERDLDFWSEFGAGEKIRILEPGLGEDVLGRSSRRVATFCYPGRYPNLSNAFMEAAKLLKSLVPTPGFEPGTH